MKEKIIKTMIRRELLLKERIVRNNGSNCSLYRLEIKFADALLKGIWTLSLIKTSIQVTKTPITTLKSILKTNLGLRGKGKATLNYQTATCEDERTPQNLPRAPPLTYRLI